MLGFLAPIAVSVILATNPGGGWLAGVSASAWLICALTAARIMIEVCDTHFHVYSEADRYPLIANRGYDPPVVSLNDYQKLFSPFGVRYMVLIQPSCYGTDNRCMLEDMAATRAETRAIAAIAPDIADSELNALHSAGVRGIRLNVMSVAGSTIPQDRLRDVATKLSRLSWALQTFVPIGRLPDIADTLLETGLNILIDHFGSVDPALGINPPTMKTLLRMLETGRCWVKLSAPFRISKAGPPYDDMVPYVKELVRARPDRMIWGSDWPYIHFIDKVGPAYNPLELLQRSITDEAQLRAVLAGNAKALFGFAGQMR